MASCATALANAQYQSQQAQNAGLCNAVWGQWNLVYDSAVTMGASRQAYVTGGLGSSNYVIWGNWNQAYTTNVVTVSNVVETNVVWGAWNQAYGLAANQAPYSIRAETPEQRQRREAEYEIRLQAELVKLREREAAQKLAQAKAEKLLLSHLDEDQAAEFRKSRQFVMRSSDGERCYRVEYGVAGNIRLLDKNGKAVAKFCIHPAINLPVEDVMLTQKLLFEADEKEFLRIANRTQLAAA